MFLRRRTTVGARRTRRAPARASRRVASPALDVNVDAGTGTGTGTDTETGKGTDRAGRRPPGRIEPLHEPRRVALPGEVEGASERGAVTAETALVLPMLVAVTLAMAWLLSLAATQVRVVDAAREVARAAARDETRPAAVSLGRRVAPRGSSIRITEDGMTVVARVRTTVDGPGGLLAFLPEVELASEAVAAKEQQ